MHEIAGDGVSIITTSVGTLVRLKHAVELETLVLAGKVKLIIQ